jgi:hypothetical protein
LVGLLPREPACAGALLLLSVAGSHNVMHLTGARPLLTHQPDKQQSRHTSQRSGDYERLADADQVR